MKAELAAIAAELESRIKAEESFYEFFKQAWHVFEPGYKYVDNWHVGAVAEHLEAVTRGQIPKLLVNFPPRCLKTDLISVAWPAWEWIKTPNRKFLCGSYSWTLAEDASIKCRQLIKSNWYQTRWGERFGILDDRDKKDHFANDKGGERIITSPDATGTGRGGDRIIVDDGNNVRDQSDTMLDSALNWWTQVLPTRVNDPEDSSFVVVQQRVHERDISGHILATDKSSWVHLCLPNEYEARRRCVTVVLPSTKPAKWRDPRRGEGELFFPRRISKERSDSLRASLGEYGYAGQYQQLPSPAEGGIIRKAWFQPWKQERRPKCDFIFQSWDTATSERKNPAGRGIAYSCCHTYGVFKSEKGLPGLLLLARWRGQVEYPELRKTAQLLANDYLDSNWRAPMEKLDSARTPQMILVEDKSSGKNLIADFARAGIFATRFNPDRYGDKTQRVRLVTHLMEAGVVWVPYAAPHFDRPPNWVDQFLMSMATFPNAQSRDDVDCLTQALLRMVESGWVYHPTDMAAKPKIKYADDDTREPLY